MATLRAIGLICGLAAAGVEAQDTPRAGVAAWDTGTPSLEPLAAEAVDQKAGWTKIDGPLKPGDLKGDLAVTNGRLLTVVRRKGSGPDFPLTSGECYFVRMTAPVDYLIGGSSTPGLAIPLDPPGPGSITGTNFITQQRQLFGHDFVLQLDRVIEHRCRIQFWIFCGVKQLRGVVFDEGIEHARG